MEMNMQSSKKRRCSTWESTPDTIPIEFVSIKLRSQIYQEARSGEHDHNRPK